MKINCLCCGHSLDLGEAYEDYEGKVKCFVCGGMLEIKAIDGNLKSAERSFETIPFTDVTCAKLNSERVQEIKAEKAALPQRVAARKATGQAVPEASGPDSSRSEIISIRY